jgi:hypothetical protein
VAKLNHTIVAARDRKASALFLSGLLGLAPPLLLGPFAVVSVDDDLTLDFMDSGDDIRPQHYAFLVSETEFDQTFARIEERRLPYGPIRAGVSVTRSIIGTTGAAYISTILMGICSRY